MAAKPRSIKSGERSIGLNAVVPHSSYVVRIYVVRICITILYLFLFSSAVGAASFNTALEYYNNGNYKKAGEIWKKVGNSSYDSGASFHNVAELYKNGLGFTKNEGFAASWYKRAAEKGYVPSMFALGSLYYLEGSEAIRHTNSGIFWWEKAAKLGDASSLIELSRLYLLDQERRDLLQSRTYARSALSLAPNSKAVLDLMQKTARSLNELNIGGSRSIARHQTEGYFAEIVATSTFSDAWVYTVSNAVKGAYIYRNVYNDYIVSVGPFKNVDAAFDHIRALPKSVLALKPRPRSVSVVKKELLPVTNHPTHQWISGNQDRDFTVELYRSDSMVDAYDFIDANALSNSVAFFNNVGEAVVVAGAFKSLADAQSVALQLPESMKRLNPQPTSFAEVKRTVHPNQLYISASRDDLLSAPVVNQDSPPTQESLDSGNNPVRNNHESDNEQLNSRFALYEAAQDWLFSSPDQSFTIQIETIKSDDDPNARMNVWRAKLNRQDIYSLDQKTPNYIYFLFGRYESAEQAQQSIDANQLSDVVIRNVGRLKKNRCENWRNLNSTVLFNQYCSSG